MSLHDLLIKTIINSPVVLESNLGMQVSKITHKISLGKNGDIDIKVDGINSLTHEPCLAIVEVKTHDGLIPHYLRKQLPKYQERYPDAMQYVAYSLSGKSTQDIAFKRIR
ncbi:MAG: hypothetical protein WC867_03280 [Candidatus Pacearchaeota archaeon]|jgi:hypothetical protein